MKILQVFDFFSPAQGGGTVFFLEKLMAALREKGHRITLYTSDYKIDRPYLESLRDINVFPFHCLSGLAGFYLTPGMVGEARKRLKDFDIVHLHCFRSFQNIVIRHYARKYGVPYIIDAHGSLPRLTIGDRRGPKWLLKWMFDVIFGRRLLRDASRLIAETEVGMDEYREYGAGDAKIVMITPPFPTGDFAVLPARGIFRRKYGISEKHVVTFLGRLNWIKGLDFLVSGFAELAKVMDDVRLVLVGPDDGYQAALEKLIDELGIGDRVLFTGFLGGEEKLSALVDADVVIQTSVYEQGAWAPLEAVLCNTPIIVSSNSGAGEDVRKIDAGYLVEYGNNLELRNMIQYVLNNPEETGAKTKQAKEYIEANMSMAVNIDRYIAVYKEIIEGV